mmetsp:Transcript_130503/g.278874  ORF Transcript_130503/g.278874 Transcript_130503/m.278874 type:complete len:221 (+) Transcript_130503:471-1133(+)
MSKRALDIDTEEGHLSPCHRTAPPTPAKVLMTAGFHTTASLSTTPSRQSVAASDAAATTTLPAATSAAFSSPKAGGGGGTVARVRTLLLASSTTSSTSPSSTASELPRTMGSNPLMRRGSSGSASCSGCELSKLKCSSSSPCRGPGSSGVACCSGSSGEAKNSHRLRSFTRSEEDCIGVALVLESVKAACNITFCVTVAASFNSSTVCAKRQAAPTTHSP